MLNRYSAGPFQDEGPHRGCFSTLFQWLQISLMFADFDDPCTTGVNLIMREKIFFQKIFFKI